MADVRKEWLDKDYYRVLGVSETASDKDITKAYRQLARENHPDTNPGNDAAEERFKEVSAAYDVLGDDDRRRSYDQVRRMGPGAMGGGGQGGFPFDMGEGVDLGDLLGGLFGGGARGGPAGFGQPRPQRGRDQETELTLDFDEAVHGVTTTVTISGGSQRSARELKVRIPAGVHDGSRIRLKGKGGSGGNGGPPGDLFVVTRVRRHETFGRDGNNLTIDLPISFVDAVRGGTLSAPTFEGDPVKLKMPAGTDSGKTFRVRGKGIETKKSTGDLLVTVHIDVPHEVNDEQLAALEAFEHATIEAEEANQSQEAEAEVDG